ncbi:zinc transporter ZIP1-like [Panulirus ornatus]|uniref:zinc transporter ZIP1-like n=1 Tax=Panulirus ornatus TaxID=150431 RepID=UPI003A837537
MLGLVETKAVVLSLMTVLTLAASFLPLLVRRLVLRHLHSNSTQMFLSGCLCFGGGVLLATVFLHLLPETRYYMQEAMDSGFIPQIPYPLAELIVCVGFFFIYIIEEVVHSCIHQNHHKKQKTNESLKMNVNVQTPCKSNLTHANTDVDVDDECLEKFLHEERESSSQPEVVIATPALDEGLSVMRAVVVVVALSLHSIMEGLALGLVHKPKDVWLLFGALSAHKLIIAFCMAMELLEVGVTLTPFMVSMIIFSLASPIGGLAGTLVTSMIAETTASGVLVPTFLQGFSAGTILYVTFCEVLERERARPRGGQVRMWTFLIGFVFMAGLQVLDTYVPVSPEQSATPYVNLTADNVSLLSYANVLDDITPSVFYTDVWEDTDLGSYTEAWEDTDLASYTEVWEVTDSAFYNEIWNDTTSLLYNEV